MSVTFSFSWRSPCAKDSTLTAQKKLVAVSASEWRWEPLTSWHNVDRRSGFSRESKDGKKCFLILIFSNGILGNDVEIKCRMKSKNRFILKMRPPGHEVIACSYLSQLLFLTLLCMLRLWIGSLIISIVNTSACTPKSINQPKEHAMLQNWQLILIVNTSATLAPLYATECNKLIIIMMKTNFHYCK